MRKETPLRLQVFHSLNEYKAHWKNRNELMRLKDLEGALKREEKLYAKEYKLHRSQFHARCARRFSEPSANTQSSTSRDRSLSRASVFSAPASLRHLRETSTMASRFCESLNDISSSTRFQRIQRKFSIANFTEKGLLTKKGADFFKDIGKARQVLFKTTKSPAAMSERTLPVFSEEDDENEDDEEDNDLNEDQNDEDDFETKISGGNAENSNLAASSFDESKSKSQFRKRSMPTAKDLGVARTANLETVLKDTTKGQQKDTNKGKEISNISPLKANRQNSQSATTSAKSRKRVSICTPHTRTESPNFDALTAPKTESSDGPLLSRFSKVASDPDSNIDADCTDWKSIFSRKLAKPVDPLQMKIKKFLTDQNDFNKLFPKGSKDEFDSSSIPEELIEIERQKKAQKTVDHKRKVDMIIEVLDTLGIDDENIRFHYKHPIE